MFMGTITLNDIEESDILKKEACNRVKESMRDKLSEEQLQEFEKVFYSLAEGYIFAKRVRK